MDDLYKELTIAIIIQSIEDYRYLNRIHKSKLHCGKGVVISKSEIRRFLLSDYCDFLLQNMKITGKDILNYLDR